MNIRKALEKENSKRNVLEIIDFIGNDANKFAVLMDIFLNDGNRLTQRAAWVMSHCANNKAFLIEPYIEKMIKMLSENNTDAVTRNIVRILQDVAIPEELMGMAFDICYEFVAKVETPIAIKAFSMTILYNICKKEPDLKNEVMDLISMQLEHGSKGVIGRGKKVIGMLGKL